MNKRIALCAAALALSAAAQAETYIGGALGSSDIDINCSVSLSCETSDTGVKIYGGYELPKSPIPGLALEIAYIDFGQASANRGVVNTLDVSALTFGGAMRLKFAPAFSGVGRLGLAYVDGSDNGTGVFGIGAKSDSNIELYYGLGLEYALNKQFKLTGAVDFTDYDTGNQSGSVHLLSIGLQYGF
jgi:OOP family OmpA-OmpF porin